MQDSEEDISGLNDANKGTTLDPRCSPCPQGMYSGKFSEDCLLCPDSNFTTSGYGATVVEDCNGKEILFVEYLVSCIF